MEKSLTREMIISKLLRTPEEVDFHSNHTIVYGIYDDYGLESISACRDWDNIEGLSNLIERIRFLNLRCRFNPHRNSKFYIRWISNKNFTDIENIIKDGEFEEAKNFLIQNSKPY